MQLNSKRRREQFAWVALIALSTASLSSCVPTERDATSGDGSWADKFATCMSESGWVVETSADGGVASEFPESQRDIYEAEAAICAQQAGSGVRPTEEQFEIGYQGLTDDHDCIVEAGYDLPPPPSYQAWREMDGRWNPFMEVPSSLSSDELEVLIELCTPTGI